MYFCGSGDIRRDSCFTESLLGQAPVVAAAKQSLRRFREPLVHTPFALSGAKSKGERQSPESQGAIPSVLRQAQHERN